MSNERHEWLLSQSLKVETSEHGAPSKDGGPSADDLE